VRDVEGWSVNRLCFENHLCLLASTKAYMNSITLGLLNPRYLVQVLPWRVCNDDMRWAYSDSERRSSIAVEVMNKVQGTTVNKTLLTHSRLQRNVLSNSLSQVLEDRPWKMRETTAMHHDYIPYRNELASSYVCVLGHSSHQVHSLLTPFEPTIISSLFKLHNYARHADTLAQYLGFSMYYQRIQRSMTSVSAAALSAATSTSGVTTKVPTPCSTLFASVVVLTGL